MDTYGATDMYAVPVADILRFAVWTFLAEPDRVTFSTVFEYHLGVVIAWRIDIDWFLTL
jgi:hypothetical protein